MLRLAGALLLLACASTSGGSAVAPNSPRPTREPGALAAGSGSAGQGALSSRPIEITAVRLRRVRGDTMLTRLAGPVLLQRAPDVIAVDVTTAESFGSVPRSSSPEIYLDNVRIQDTWPLPPNRLVAFVTDTLRLREGVAVTAAWLGDEERTRSRRPIVLTAAHLQGIR